MSSAEVTPKGDFIRDIIAEDIRTGKHGGRVETRFPPNPTVTCISGMPNRSA